MLVANYAIWKPLPVRLRHFVLPLILFYLDLSSDFYYCDFYSTACTNVAFNVLSCVCHKKTSSQKSLSPTGVS